MAHAEGWHENALQRAFDGAWDDAIGWLTKMQNEHTQQHPVDCAMVSFNLGVLYLETTKADRLLLSARAFAEAIEAHESGPAGDEGKPNPVLTDAKQWHAGAMELHSALVQTTTADAKVLETRRNHQVWAGLRPPNPTPRGKSCRSYTRRAYTLQCGRAWQVRNEAQSIALSLMFYY